MRVKRDWHPHFLKYMEFIVKHRNYATLPNKFKKDGSILWVSPSDIERAKWWDLKIKKLHVTDRASVARKIHPSELKGMKPCQICGQEMNINYVYPQSRILKKLLILAPDANITVYDDVMGIFEKLSTKMGEGVFEIFSDIFKIPPQIKKEKSSYVNFVLKNRSTILSPGAMSNPPDRLDGFHTYNLCCRSQQDTGRSRANLSRYSQDRRVYENWTDGNWKLSNRVMGMYGNFDKKLKCPSCGKIKKLTADHVGPVSLGFSHRPEFNPLCRACNSRKNNRLSYKDVQQLLQDEAKGKQVISWHSKYLWDILKDKVSSTSDALKLSKIMRLNLHHILTLFSILSDEGHDEFLKQFLHPEYSFVDYKFIDFNPLNPVIKYQEFKSIDKNTKKNAERYIRISFEKLQEYKKIENRNTKKWDSKIVDESVDKLLSSLKAHSVLSLQLLKKTIQILAIESAKKF